MNKLLKSRTALARHSTLAFTMTISGMTMPDSRAAVIAADNFESYNQGFALSDGFQPAGGSGFATPWGAPGRM